MKPIRLFFYILLLFYHITLVAFAINLNDDVANNLVQGSGTVLLITLIGLGLFAVIFALAQFDRRRYHKKISKLEAEKNEIKAQVYDMKRRDDQIDEEIKSFESSIEDKKTTPDKSSDTDQKKLT